LTRRQRHPINPDTHKCRNAGHAFSAQRGEEELDGFSSSSPIQCDSIIATVLHCFTGRTGQQIAWKRAVRDRSQEGHHHAEEARGTTAARPSSIVALPQLTTTHATEKLLHASCKLPAGYVAQLKAGRVLGSGKGLLLPHPVSI
jgi:hypothetical protein